MFEYSGGSRPLLDEQEELPQWRVELSRRLQEIKEKRGSGDAKMGPDDGTLPFPLPNESAPERPELHEAPPVSPPKPSRRPARGSVAISGRKSADGARSPKPIEEPATTPAAPQTRVVPNSGASGIPDLVLKPASARALAVSGDVRNLIDDVVARRSSHLRATEVPAQIIVTLDEEQSGENKLILLSRTLSGMIDLLAVFLCTMGFVIAEDVFSGIEIFDEISFVNAGLVFVATYFLYSLFFLGAANQTIGMMITHLRLVAESGNRPAFGRILSRCVMFVLSVAALGVGLLLGCFDPQSRCLHDRLSGTRIEPLLPPM